ncbi:unnamed protein product, partial [Polarella glacialis]
AAEALLASGADPEARTDDARTPLSYAAARGHVAAVCKLMDFKADVQALDNVRQTALHHAAANGRAEVIEPLVNKRARLDQKDGSNRSPIQLALDSRQDVVVRMLLKLGASLPEMEAQDPKLQPMIREIETEVLQEQLKEAESSAGKAHIKAAEMAFEEARIKLLKLTMLSATAMQAPIIHMAELKLQDAMELAKSCGNSADILEDQVREISEIEKGKRVEAKKKLAGFDTLKEKIEEYRVVKASRLAEMEDIKKHIVQVTEAAKACKTAEVGSQEGVPEALEKTQALREELVRLREDSEVKAAALQEVREKIGKWVSEKEAVAELHAQAHALLHRHTQEKHGESGYPGSLSTLVSPKAEPAATETEAATAAPAGEAPSTKPATPEDLPSQSISSSLAVDHLADQVIDEAAAAAPAAAAPPPEPAAPEEAVSTPADPALQEVQAAAA